MGGVEVMDRDEYLKLRSEYIQGEERLMIRFDLLIGLAALIGFVVSVWLHSIIGTGARAAWALSFLWIVLSELTSANAFRLTREGLDRMYADDANHPVDSWWSRLTTALNWCAFLALLGAFALTIADVERVR